MSFAADIRDTHESAYAGVRAAQKGRLKSTTGRGNASVANWFGLVDDCSLLAARFRRNWLEHMEVDVLCSFKPACKIRCDASCGILVGHVHSLFLFNVADLT